MLQRNKRTPVQSELQKVWLRYLNLMIESNIIHCSAVELDTFYSVYNSDSYSYSDGVIMNYLLKKHPLKKLKKLQSNGSEPINF